MKHRHRGLKTIKKETIDECLFNMKRQRRNAFQKSPDMNIVCTNMNIFKHYLACGFEKKD
jgi:hypothetical protein